MGYDTLFCDSNTKMRYLILFFCYLIPEITGRRPEIPSQIHLSYHNARTRSISWVTFEKSPQYLFLKERNVGRLKRSLVFRSNEKVFEASTTLFVEPEMNLVGKDFFSLSPPIAPTSRYIH